MLESRWLAAGLCLLLVAGCASREVLEPLPGEPPAGTDLSGYFELSSDRGEIERRISAAIRATDGAGDRVVLRPPEPAARGGRRNAGRVNSGLVYVFLETGETLKITQTASALFVSFDRAVVEEYRFGENREVRVGQATAQRVSGWVDGDYVIETLGRNGMKLTERYQLSDDGDTLVRRMTFRSKGDETRTVIERYARSKEGRQTR